MSEQAGVRLWGRTIGAVLLEDGEDAAVFQYTPEFAAGGIEVSPLTMPLRPEPYAFPTLAYDAFKGLPGMLADSLPDRYGNALIDALARPAGAPAGERDAVERLCYMGIRGMGALEFAPTKGPDPTEEEDIQVAELVSLASGILSERDGFETTVAAGKEENGLLEILSVGMSAGGARAKAMIAWERETDRVRSGQVEAPPGFEHWLLKFDGVSADGDRESLESPRATARSSSPTRGWRRRRGSRWPDPPFRGGRPAALHDPALRSPDRRRRSCTCSRSALYGTSTSTSTGPTPTSRPS